MRFVQADYDVDELEERRESKSDVVEKKEDRRFLSAHLIWRYKQAVNNGAQILNAVIYLGIQWR